MASELDEEIARSLVLEKKRPGFWYGLTGKVRDIHTLEYIVNCGGPNEAIELAQQATLPEIFTGPYELFLPSLDTSRSLHEVYGLERQAIRVASATMAARGYVYESRVSAQTYNRPNLIIVIP